MIWHFRLSGVERKRYIDFGIGETAALMGYLGTTVLLAGAAYAGVSAMTNTPKAPDANAVTQPTKPSEDTAAADAQSQITQSRRTMLAGGGDTMLTGKSGAPLLGPDVASKTLLGG